MTKVERFSYRLAGMRKADNYIVYPRKPGGDLIVQGSRTIAQIDPKTGAGVLNWKGNNGKYFLHLSRRMGAEPVQFPKEFVGLAIEYCPSSGDLIGSSPVTGPVYLA
jgi:hypothetical protein